MSRSTLVCLFLVGCCAIAQQPAKVPIEPARPKPRELGAEWVKIKPTEAGDKETIRLSRPIVGSSRRSVNGYETTHGITLESGCTLSVREMDDKSATSVTLYGKPREAPLLLASDRQMHFEREENKDGTPGHQTVCFGPVTYHDLDGDGVIDCWRDHRDFGKSSILFEGRVIRVENSRVPFFENPKGAFFAWGEGRDVAYEFTVTNRKWTIVKR